MADLRAIPSSQESEATRWSDVAQRLLNIRYTKDDPALLTDLNVLLDELNSFYYNDSRIIWRNSDSWAVLSKCCHLITTSGDNDFLVTKFCQLIINILNRQKVPVNDTVLQELLDFLLLSLRSCQKWAVVDHLKALGAVLYENGGRINKYILRLIGSKGILTKYATTTTDDIEIVLAAVRCIGNLCLRTNVGHHLDEENVLLCLESLVKVLQTSQALRLDELEHCRLVVCTLKAIQGIMSVVHGGYHHLLTPLLTTLKSYASYGMPGYKPPREYTADQDDEEGILDDLSSVDIPDATEKSLRYPKLVVRKKKRSRGRGGGKGGGNKGPTPPMSPHGRGGQQRIGQSSVPTNDFYPAFCKMNLDSHHARDVPRHNEQTHEATSPTMSSPRFIAMPSSPGHTHKNHDEENINKPPSGESSDYDSLSATSSDSDYSDSEIGQAEKLRSSSSKVRQSALACLHLLIKVCDKKMKFGFWSAFIPDGQSSASWSLFTTILKDPVPKARSAALSVLTELIEGSKQFLQVAVDDLQSLGSSDRPFTPFSVKLGSTLHEVHRCLLQALVAESSVPTICSIVKCLSVLVLNGPYDKLSKGLLTKVIKQLRPFLSHDAPMLRAGTFSCFTAILSVHAPLQEVIQALEYPNASNDQDSSLSRDQAREQNHTSDTASNKERFSAEKSWLADLCFDVVQSPSSVPYLHVKLEAICVLMALTSNYFTLISSSVPALTELACDCVQSDDPQTAVRGIKFLEEIGKSLYQQLQSETEKVEVSKEEVVAFWMKLLQGPLLRSLQEESVHMMKLRASACDCLSNIGPIVFQSLPADKQILCITLLLGMIRDDDATSKGAAIRCLGVFVSYPCLQEDVLFLADTANSILTAMSDTALGVIMRAAWALGNLSETLVINRSKDESSTDEFSDLLLMRLLEVAVQAASGHERVKSNAVRALGNFLRYLRPQTLDKTGFSGMVEKAVFALASNVQEGLMKVRWNACYAVGNMFHNSALPLGEASWTAPLFNALLEVIKNCKNFKVRINASNALSVPTKRHCYGERGLFCSIWSTATEVLESTDTLNDFAEFRYRDTLREQLCHALCHMASLVSTDDLPALVPVLRKNQKVLQRFISSHYEHLQTQVEKDEEAEVADEKNAEKLQMYSLAEDHIINDLDNNPFLLAIFQT